jgi:hypothetical protein
MNSKVIVSNTTNFPRISYEKRIQVKSGMLKYFWVKRKNLKNDMLQSKEDMWHGYKNETVLYEN